jgi:hypothetical protein
MSLDYDSLLYTHTYDRDIGFGVQASLDLGTAGLFPDLTVIDKTAGVMIDEGNSLQLATVKVAALIRISELTENNLTRASIKQGKITFNNNSWTILATQPKPNPNGDGELYLILEKA